MPNTLAKLLSIPAIAVLFSSTAPAASGPDLAVAVTRTSAFLRGQTNAVYLIRATNNGDAPTTGTITVTESMPSGITITAMNGPGWSCTTNTCSRADSFPAGQMLPTISVLATVDANAPDSVANLVTVSGGGDPNVADNVTTDVSSIASEGWLLGTQNQYDYTPAIWAPQDLSDAVAIAASSYGALALHKNGTVAQWGPSYYSNYPTPVGLTNVTGIATTARGFYALKSDGTVYAWSLYQTLPTAALANIVSIAAGNNFLLALDASGTVTALGFGTSLETTVPAGLANVVQISAGISGSFALTAQGSVVAWGNRVPPTPPSLGKLVRVERVALDTAAGIRPDGTVVVWDQDGTSELLNIPAGLNGVAALTGDGYIVALKNDGTTRSWGTTTDALPESLNRMANTRALAATSTYALAVVSARPVTLTVNYAQSAVDITKYGDDGPAYRLDSVTYKRSTNKRVTPGSIHTLSVDPVQFSSSAYGQFTFSSWSDGGPTAHDATVGAANTTFTLDYTTKFRLATQAGAGGTISPATAYYDPGTSVLVQATPSAGYLFSNFSGNYVTSSANNPARFLLTSPASVTASFLPQSGLSFRILTDPSRPVVQGQTNAAFTARVVNDGATPLTGTQVQISGVTVASLSGAGWVCSGSTCNRTDTLPAGQAYPAIVAVATIPANATGVLWASLTATANNTYSSAYVPFPVTGAGNTAVCWGDNSAGQCSVPNGLTNLVGIAAGTRHTVALRGDGTATAWGDNSKQQTQIPAGQTNLVAIAAGANHTLALTRAGAVVAWGDNTSGQSTVPAGLASVLAIAAGASHSLALTTSGTVVAWGANGSGQTTVPASVVDAVAIAAAGDHSLAVLRNGTVVAWGSNTAGESAVPANLAPVESVAAGPQYSLAVQRDGAVVAWGNQPPGFPAGLTNVRRLSAGAAHALALQWDGSLQAWGTNTNGQTNIPAGLTDITAVAAGATHSVVVAPTPALVPVSFATTPGDASYTVDGVTYTSAQTFTWLYGSTHTVTIPSPQLAPAAGTRYVFHYWNDFSTLTTRVLTPTAPTNYTLQFDTQYLLATSATTGGSVTPPPAYYDAGTPVTVTATPADGYAFTGFSGSVQGTQNPRPIPVTQPLNVTANFAAITGGAQLTAAIRHTGIFLQGQTNAAYHIRVRNTAGHGPTSGPVTVAPQPPAGLHVTLMTGLGWTCTTASCTRSDALPSGSSYPDLTVLTAIDAQAASSLTLQVSVSGGGSATATASHTAAVPATSVPVTWTHSYVEEGRLPFPAGLSDVVSLAAGTSHFIALKKNGTVVAWGDNDSHQCDVPAGLTNVIAVTAAARYSAALQADGQVVLWGSTPIPAPDSADLTNAVTFAAGTAFMTVVRNDGTLRVWGDKSHLNTTVISLVRDAVSVAANSSAIALTSDGTPVTLDMDSGDLTPPSVRNAISISASDHLFAAVGTDGSVTTWSHYIQQPLPDSWTNLAAVALGTQCNLALTRDGTVVPWNCSGAGPLNIPDTYHGVVGIVSNESQSAILTTNPPPVSLTVVNYGGNQKYTVDGTEYTEAHLFTWPYGSTHTVSAPSPVYRDATTRSVFYSWSDQGAATHTIVAASPYSNTLSAMYREQYLVTVQSSQGGSVTISPSSSDGWYQYSTLLQVTAVPAVGYAFSGFTGTLNGTTNPQSFNIVGPVTIGATFTALPTQLTADSVLPASGSGASATLAATFTDSLGAANITWVQLLIAAASDGGGQPFCFLHYDVQGDRFWVYGDGGFFVGPVQPGTASAGLQNTLCALNTKTSTITKAGNNLSFLANVVFKSAASRKVFLRAQSLEGLDTGWVQRGTWTTAATPTPTLTIQPVSGSGAQPTFTLNYPDPAGFEDTTMGWSQFLIAAAPDGGGQPFCFLHYDKAGNGLWMYSSDVGFFLGPVAPGTASNALDSSACAINTAGTAVAHPSGLVTITVPVTLKAPMAGPKQTYQRTLDALGRDSGWLQTGTWTIP